MSSSTYGRARSGKPLAVAKPKSGCKNLAASDHRAMLTFMHRQQDKEWSGAGFRHTQKPGTDMHM